MKKLIAKIQALVLLHGAIETDFEGIQNSPSLDGSNHITLINQNHITVKEYEDGYEVDRNQISYEHLLEETLKLILKYIEDHYTTPTQQTTKEILQPTNDYAVFLMAQLAMCCDVVDKQEAYDILWGQAAELYGKFLESEFDVDEHSEYQCILNFLETQPKLNAKLISEIQAIVAKYGEDGLLNRYDFEGVLVDNSITYSQTGNVFQEVCAFGDTYIGVNEWADDIDNGEIEPIVYGDVPNDILVKIHSTLKEFELERKEVDGE